MRVSIILALLVCCTSTSTHLLQVQASGEASGQCTTTTPGSCDDVGADADADGTNVIDDDFDDEAARLLFEENIASTVPYTKISDLSNALTDYYGTDYGDGVGVTSMMQKYVEQTLVTRTRIANKKVEYAYASFGSMLDISTISSSTWAGSTSFGGKIPWLSSLIHRESLISERNQYPCELEQYSGSGSGSSSCLIGVTVDRYVSVRGTKDVQRQDMLLAKQNNILDKGSIITGNVMHLEFEDKDKFDTIVANGVLAAVDTYLDPDAQSMENMDIVLEKLVSFLNPKSGGTLYLVGWEPMTEDVVEGPGAVYKEVMDVFDSVKSLAGEYPKRDLDAKWIQRKLERLGLHVTTKLYPAEYEFEDMQMTIHETLEWLDELEDGINDQLKNSYYSMLNDLEGRVERATVDGPVFVGVNTYIISAELKK